MTTSPSVSPRPPWLDRHADVAVASQFTGSEKQRYPACQRACLHGRTQELGKQRNGFAFFQQVDTASFTVVD